MIVVREPESIYRIEGEIENGTFSGRWHFSFGDYHDPDHMQFGTLRVFNDDTLSPGAVWPLHPHRDIEVVTYCAEGEFRHADERGEGGVLKKGWVQHTTVGSGMMHSEINNRKDARMRFIQMWFLPAARGLKPAVEQKKVSKEERTNRLLPIVSSTHPGALRIKSDAVVCSCFLQRGRAVDLAAKAMRGFYLYVIEGGAVKINGHYVPALGAAMIRDKSALRVTAENDAELLLVEVPVNF